MPKIQKFDRQNLKVLRTELTDVLKSVENKYGIKISLGAMTFDSNEFRVKMTCNTENSGALRLVEGITSNPNSVIGKRVMLKGGKIGTVVDYKPRNYKYPYIVETGGKRYKVHKPNFVN